MYFPPRQSVNESISLIVGWSVNVNGLLVGKWGQWVGEVHGWSVVNQVKDWLVGLLSICQSGSILVGWLRGFVNGYLSMWIA